MQYVNPGRMYIEEHGQVQNREDVLGFAHFLRKEASLTAEPPVDLARIYRRFGMPLPKRASLPNLQGLLISPERGVILIEDSDIPSRQRFTEAHELVELLFSALPPGKGWAARQRVGTFKRSAKERLCDEGATELLMPRSTFGPRVRRAGVTFRTARELAAEYHVSVTAALVRVAHVGPGRHAVVLWRMKYKPSEIKKKASPGQLSLFGTPGTESIPRKLRVEWALGGPDTPYIPQYKSIPIDSSIHQAWRDGAFVSGEDNLDLGPIAGMFRCESWPFAIEGETCVLSLLHMPGDTGCGSSAR